MKKTLLTIASVAITVCAVAQKMVKPSMTAIEVPIEINSSSLLKTTASSTLFPASLMTGGCATSTTSTGGLAYYSIAQATATPQYTIDTRGYLFGTNLTSLTYTSGTVKYRDTRAAQKYSVTGTGITVTDIIVYASKPKSNNGTTMIMGQVYSENTTTKAPSAQIGNSAIKALNSFTSGVNVINFTTPVSISAGNFFAAIESPAIGGATNDTLAILSTKLGCSSTDTLSWTFTDDIPSTGQGTWSSIKSAYGANLDAAIFPVINITTGLSSISKNGLTLSASYPNPASTNLTVNFGLALANNVNVEICDLTGKVISTSNLGKLEAGDHSSKIDVSMLSSGIYLYSVQSEGAKMYSKFTIAK